MSEVEHFEKRNITYTVYSQDCVRTTSYDNLDDLKKRCKNLVKRGMKFRSIKYHPVHVNGYGVEFDASYSIFFGTYSQKPVTPGRHECYIRWGKLWVEGYKVGGGNFYTDADSRKFKDEEERNRYAQFFEEVH